MKVTVCQLSDNKEPFNQEWEELVAHVQSNSSRLVLLPEMPFYPWFARQENFDESIWNAAMLAHEEWLERLPELAPAVVLSSRPVEKGGRRLNEAYVWEPEYGYQGVHGKFYLPDEEYYWEASWYQRGDSDFPAVQAGEFKVGFLVCSEMWFMEHARGYGKQAAHIIAVPRATPNATRDKWLAGGRTAAVVSGAYCLSSCCAGPLDEPLALGGQGWVIGPDGEVVGTTSRDDPFLTAEIDLREAERAKNTYPRYVLD